MNRTLISFIVLFFYVAQVYGQQNPTITEEKVYQDKHGVIRWINNNQEVALFGANYCLPSACDYRAAGYVTKDRKKMVDQDMAHFARMGWDGLRLCLWGDYENTDTSGNLIDNDHLNLMDYLILKAKERGIYFLLSPIVTYGSQWPDAMHDTVSAKGFSTYFKKEELGTNPKAIAAQQNYLKQLLNHVNPYTKTALKDEPNILFVEMINEPWHHSNDLQGSVNYINALVDAVRSTGCNKILFHNISQDFNMAKTLQQSKIQGASFAWYPSGLNSGRTIPTNYLPVVDDYSLMLKPEISKLSRIVYEFDSPDLLTAYMYPAMARNFRTAGAQFAAIFSYDMLQTAPYNLGWQTHFINMVYTPVKAVSGIIAAEVMKKIPRYKNYGKYPANTSFGSFKVDYESNLSEMVTADKFYYANNSGTKPLNVRTLTKIVGYGSSPIVKYEGKGIYFLDKIKDGTWRLEVYPDAVLVDDPFKMPSPGKLVSRSISRNWPISVHLPDLGDTFSVHPINIKNRYKTNTADARFTIQPGVYILTGDKNFNRNSLPQKMGNIGMDEFEILEDQLVPVQVMLNYQPEYVLGKPLTISANVYSKNDPGNVTLFLKAGNRGRAFPLPMKKDSGYTYTAEIPGNRIQEGWIEYCIGVKDGNNTINFPSGINKLPTDWDYYGSQNWKSKVVKEKTPLILLNAAEDADKLAFTRIGDGIRFGIYKLIPASNTGEAAFHLELPLSYDRTLDDYTLSVAVKEKVLSRRADIVQAKSLILTVKGMNQQQQAYITLVENDGTSWSKKISLKPEWNTIKIPLNELEQSKGAILPLGYPGRWAYWFTPADGRTRAGDKIKIDKVESIQLSIRQNEMKKEDAKANSYVDITSAILLF
ncbi:MAG: cellulase family glycosylhydrolase [Ferruginibacter sp.]|nr:cellulase family glycosylhydrolase [Ferruginibacter sp.]